MSRDLLCLKTLRLESQVNEGNEEKKYDILGNIRNIRKEGNPNLMNDEKSDYTVTKKRTDGKEEMDQAKTENSI